MKRILRYISYTLMYLVISIASAYGVILISWNGNSSSSPAESTAQMPEQISNIVMNIMQNSALDFDLQATISTVNEQEESLSSQIVVSADAQLDFSKGLENLALASDIKISSNDQNLSLGLTYLDQNLYIDAFNNKFYISTNNFINSLSQLLQNFGLELPALDFDLGSLDLNQLLPLLSNLKETVLDESRMIEIELPEIGAISIETDLNYNLKSVKIPTISVENYQIDIQGTFVQTENATITIDPEGYKDLTAMLDLANKFLNYINKNDVIALDGAFSVTSPDLSLKEQSLSLYIDKNQKAVSVNVADFLNLTLKDNKIYFNIFNIYLQFDLTSLPDLLEMLQNNFNIELPSFVTDILSMNFENLEDILGNLPSFNLSDLDLSIVEQLYKENDSFYFTLKNIGEFVVESNDEMLSSISFTSDFATADLGFKENAVMPEFDEEKYQYSELSQLIPYIESFSTLFSSNIVEGSFNLIVGAKSLQGQIKIINAPTPEINTPTTETDTSTPEANSPTTEIYISLNEGRIKVALYGSKIFVQLDTFKFLLDTSDGSAQKIIESLKTFLSEIGLSDINLSLNNLLYLLLSQLHADVNESLVTDITVKSNSLDLEFANNYLMKLNQTEDGIKLFMTDFVISNVIVELKSSQDDSALFEIDTTYADDGFLLSLGLAAFTGLIKAHNDTEVYEFGPDTELFLGLTLSDLFPALNVYGHFEFNSDKSIKVARIAFTQDDLSILLEKNEEKILISFMGIEISSDQTTPLKEKGEEIFNQLPL